MSFEYANVAGSFDLQTEPLPRNGLWLPFNKRIKKFGEVVYKQDAFSDAGWSSAKLVPITELGGVQKFTEQQYSDNQLWSRRLSVSQYTMLVRAVPGTKVVQLQLDTLEFGRLRITGTGPLSGNQLWSHVFEADEPVRGAELVRMIHNALLHSDEATPSTPIRLILDGRVVLGCRVLKYATQFGRPRPVRTRYPDTPWRATIHRHFKKKHD